MTKQLEFDFGQTRTERTMADLYTKPAVEYFKRAFEYEPVRAEVEKREEALSADQKRAEVEKREEALNADQKRDNKTKPRMHYVLTQTNPHVVMSLLGIFTYSENSRTLAEIGCEFMSGGCAESFVRDVCELAEEMTGRCGAELYQSVAEFGEKKYDRGNFLKGAPVSQYLDSWLRHFKSHAEGTEIDPESGCLHLAHLVWNTVEAARWIGHATRDDRLVVK